MNGAQEPKLERLTLREMGQRLPHGRVLGTECRQDYELKFASSRVTIALGDVAARPEFDGRQTRMIVAALSEILVNVCGRPLGEMGKADTTAAAFLSTLVVPDVRTILYAWAWKRRRKLHTSIGLMCPDCGKLIPAGTELDIGDMPVDCYEHWAVKPTKVVTFDEPMQIKALGEVRSVTVEVPTWLGSHYDLSDRDLRNDERVKHEMVEGAIIGTDQREPEKFVRPPKGYLLDLPSDVVDQIAVEVVRLSAGPIPLLPAKCQAEKDGKRCEGAVPIPFDWRQTIS